MEASLSLSLAIIASSVFRESDASFPGLDGELRAAPGKESVWLEGEQRLWIAVVQIYPLALVHRERSSCASANKYTRVSAVKSRSG